MTDRLWRGLVVFATYDGMRLGSHVLLLGTWKITPELAAHLIVVPLTQWLALELVRLALGKRRSRT